MSTSTAIAEAVFARETVAGVWDEIQPLLAAHAAEISTFKDIPLTPAKEIYFRMDEIGMARVFTARLHGRLIGYSVVLVAPGLHHAISIQAQQDIIFIEKQHRGFGRRFIRWCDKQLEAEGVQVMRHHVNAKHNWSKILEQQGYELEELIFVRRFF